jgi:hypothetical protein
MLFKRPPFIDKNARKSSSGRFMRLSTPVMSFVNVPSPPDPEFHQVLSHTPVERKSGWIAPLTDDEALAVDLGALSKTVEETLERIERQGKTGAVNLQELVCRTEIRGRPVGRN